MAKPAKPIDFKLWTDLEGPECWVKRRGATALAVVLREAATVVSVSGFASLPDDYIVRPDKRGGAALRFRITLDPDGQGIGIDALQTCRKCGCAEDRACAGGCSWVTADKCSECYPNG